MAAQYLRQMWIRFGRRSAPYQQLLNLQEPVPPQRLPSDTAPTSANLGSVAQASAGTLLAQHTTSTNLQRYWQQYTGPTAPVPEEDPPAEPLQRDASASVQHKGNQFDQQTAETHSVSSAGERHEVLVGLALYALSTLCLAAYSIFAKLLGQQGISVLQILVVRSSIMSACSLVQVRKEGIDLWGHRRGLLVMRGAVGFAANACLNWSLTLLPLADATVLSLLAPVYVALLSPITIKEKPSRGVMVCIPALLVGIVLIAQPPFLFHSNTTARVSTLGLVIASLQGFTSACTQLMVRVLRTSEPDAVIVNYTCLVALAGSLFLSAVVPHSWVAPTHYYQVPIMLAAGLFAYANQVSMTAGLRRVKAAPATAMSYLSGVWGILGGLLIFQEVPTVLSVVGALIICGATLAVVAFEHIAKQHKVWRAQLKRQKKEAQLAVMHFMQKLKAAGHDPAAAILKEQPTTQLMGFVQEPVGVTREHMDLSESIPALRKV